MMEKKKRYQINKALSIKKRIGGLLNNKRINQCSRPFSKKCLSCGSVSISKSDLTLYMCGTKICPVCSMISSSIRAKVVTEATVQLMKKYGTTPVLIVLTLPHSTHEPLYELIHILNNAWKMLRDGGSEKQRQQNKYHKRKSWWRQHFIAEVFNLEISWNPNSGWHPHYHMIAIPKSPGFKIPMGTCPWTGAVINQENGLRSIYHQCLKQAWQQRQNYTLKVWKKLWNSYFQNKAFDNSALIETRKIIRRFPRYFVNEKHITQAIKKIQKAQIYKFPSLMARNLSNEERLLLLENEKQKAIEQVLNKKHYLLHREIAALVDIRSFFYQDKQTSKRISLTWYLNNHPQILKQI